MTNKVIKSTLAALAFVMMASSVNVASAGVASTGLANLGVVTAPIGEVESSTAKVHYRYYGHSHRGYGRRHGYRRHRRSYYGGCKRVKQRYWDGYGYSYRWVRSCR